MATAQAPEQTSEQESPADEEVAAAIAAILLGVVVVPDVREAVATLLSHLGGLAQGALTLAVATLVVQDLPTLPRGSGGPTEALEAALANAPASAGARRGNLIYRAHFAVNAAKRLAKAEDFRDGLREEVRLFEAHKEASAQRLLGAHMNDVAAARFGPILSWNHHPRGGVSHRPSHVRANGMNYDVRNPPKATDGMLPGMAMWCDCMPGPSIRGARMLV